MNSIPLKNFTKSFIGLALSACLSLGCGASDDVKEKFPDDIDISLTLDDIGDVAYQRLCSTFESWVRDTYSGSLLVTAVCTAMAVENSSDASSCGSYIAECKNTLPPEAESLLNNILAQAGCNTVDVERQGCLATVGQIRDCLYDLNDSVSDLRYTLTCAAVGEPLDDDWWKIDMPQSCTTIENACD